LLHPLAGNAEIRVPPAKLERLGCTLGMFLKQAEAGMPAAVTLMTSSS